MSCSQENIHCYENVSCSGTVYLTLDNQPIYWNKFHQHIRVEIVLDPKTQQHNQFPHYQGNKQSTLTTSTTLTELSAHGSRDDYHITTLQGRIPPAQSFTSDLLQNHSQNDPHPSVSQINLHSQPVSWIGDGNNNPTFISAQIGDGNNNPNFTSSRNELGNNNSSFASAQIEDGNNNPTFTSDLTGDGNNNPIFTPTPTLYQESSSLPTVQHQNHAKISVVAPKDSMTENRQEDILAYHAENVHIVNNEKCDDIPPHAQATNSKSESDVQHSESDLEEGENRSENNVCLEESHFDSSSKDIDEEESASEEGENKSTLVKRQTGSKREAKVSVKNSLRRERRNELEKLKSGKRQIKKTTHSNLKGISHLDNSPPSSRTLRSKRKLEQLKEPSGHKKNVKVSKTKVNKGGSKVKKVEMEKEVSCEFCDKKFGSQQEFYDHRKTQREEHKCTKCSKVFDFKAHLMVHMYNHKTKSESKSKRSANLKGDKSKDESTDKKGIPCDVCGLVMGSYPILKTHMMIHTGEAAYKCCVCGEESHSIGRFNTHMVSHRKQGKIECKICNLTFHTRTELSQHQLTHQIKCGLCSSIFPNKTSRVFHYKMMHKDDILHCNICNKMYSSQEELDKHLNYHRNRSKTQCPVCGLFVSRVENHMLRHTAGKEDEDTNKSYVCEVCSKQFKQKLSFQRHVRTHSEERPYACIECSKRFSRSGGLRRHMAIHTQEKPYVCPVCGKACSQNSNLKIHMQIHKEIVETYPCNPCGLTFSTRDSFVEHNRSAHVLPPYPPAPLHPPIPPPPPPPPPLHHTLPPPPPPPTSQYLHSLYYS